MGEKIAGDRDARRLRFLNEAVRRGFVFSDDVWDAHRSFRYATAAAAVAVCALGGLWAWSAIPSKPPAVASTASPARADTRLAAEAENEGASRARHSVEQEELLKQSVERARGIERASAARAAASDAERLAAEKQVEALQQQLGEAQTERSAIQARLETAQQALEASTRDLRDAKRQNASDAMLLDLQDSRLGALTSQLRESDEQLGRQKQLLAVNRDIRDLMGARNLHVIDVFDVDGRGKTRRAFGRAFYTEGKSLIFYAFDLASAAASPASFQAWGQREDNGTSALSLGLLYSDDQTQNRWTLKFEDAKVLEQIDAMFVTVEPPGGSRSPRGRKLLYAYLRQKPNHP